MKILRCEFATLTSCPMARTLKPPLSPAAEKYLLLFQAWDLLGWRRVVQRRNLRQT